MTWNSRHIVGATALGMLILWAPVPLRAQAEGVANLDRVPEAGCLITIGYPKFRGGLGGYARYVAVCPASWQYGVAVGQVPEAPLPRSDKRLHWDAAQGVRVRD